MSHQRESSAESSSEDCSVCPICTGFFHEQALIRLATCNHGFCHTCLQEHANVRAHAWAVLDLMLHEHCSTVQQQAVLQICTRSINASCWPACMT